MDGMFGRVIRGMEKIKTKARSVNMGYLSMAVELEMYSYYKEQAAEVMFNPCIRSPCRISKSTG